MKFGFDFKKTEGLIPPSSVIKEVEEALFDYYGLKQGRGY